MNIKTCLVVAPLNTVLNWVDEFDKWIGELDSGIDVSWYLAVEIFETSRLILCEGEDQGLLSVMFVPACYNKSIKQGCESSDFNLISDFFFAIHKAPVSDF